MELWFLPSHRGYPTLILCHPLLLLPPIFPSIRVFSNESTLRMRWPKYWSFSFSISPTNEHPGLISFRMDWLDLLAVQGTLKSLLQQVVRIIKSAVSYQTAAFPNGPSCLKLLYNGHSPLPTGPCRKQHCHHVLGCTWWDVALGPCFRLMSSPIP